MSNSRSSKIEQLFKSLRKHYKTVPSSPERTVIEHIVYASILEEMTFDQADEGLAKLLQAYVDYNEIRVTTAIELAELIGGGTVGVSCAQRTKRILQSIYESRYSFNIEDMKKGNLSKSVEFLNGLKGMTPFVSNYTSQSALGGHAIAIGNAGLDASVAIGLITEAEASKKSIPGLERTIPKSKGLEFFQLVHQFAVGFAANPKNPTVAAVFKDLKVTYTPPKPVVEKKASEEKPVVEKKASEEKPAPAKTTKKAAPAKEIVAEEVTKPTKAEVPAKPTKKKAVAPAKEVKEVKETKVSKAKPETKSKPAPVKPAPAKAAKTPPKKASAKAKPPTSSKNAKTSRTLTKKKPR